MLTGPQSWKLRWEWALPNQKENVGSHVMRLLTSPLILDNQTTKNSSSVYDDVDKQILGATVGDAGDDKEERNERECEKNRKDGAREKETRNNEEKRINEEKEENHLNGVQRLRRCSSLKTDKSRPLTPGTKKIVRFADALGLDLADVRTFFNEIPKIPNSAYSDLIYDERICKNNSPVNLCGLAHFTTPLYAATMPQSRIHGVKLDRILVPLFQQSGGSRSSLELVRERLVCLENVVVEDPIDLAIHGTIRVRNLDFHKSVHVRYTIDDWRSFSDLQAIYVPNSCDGFSDKFNFHLYCNTLKIGQRIEFAICFECKGSCYWDNNSGVNYCFQCLPASSNNTGYIPITSHFIPNFNALDWSITFY
ncbi:glycogen-binding subunit 76A-like [Venturia canescens]|uniref:glycogen-binding subunit 76A-like n=1 Tax=Venturia canescens TaxID=32260 RepID=UPI001C9BF448|nr:glycogen-binding subunit 76A-like [Venturia canescens]XP_043287002.1 glycogen-binding subunit 76A-like [Venturia canescens]XP_043287003.1 glycogen-binding subunit 76A-like [Venturia canescens]XP_043287004.1 glycogen-binding subunit 76A-like [Venturia canescens]XP_043287005.1 glycogen-binding subunit 76A-like [Venturia canescens]